MLKIVKNINGGFMTKKYIYILFSSFVLFLVFSFKGEKTITVFNEYEYIDDYKFDNYILTFDDCELNLSNFKDVFSYFNDLEFKILEIIPYKNDNIKLLKEYMNILTPRERDVLTKRYGLDNSDEITQKEIAKNLGISRSYVSRIEKRAITKILREFIKNDTKK